MRRYIWLLAVALVTCCASQSKAQSRTGFPFFFGGVDPTQIINVPIDTTAVDIPIAQPVQRQATFKFLDLFPKFGLGSLMGKPKIGQSIFPSQNSASGADILNAFRVRRAPSIGQ